MRDYNYYIENFVKSVVKEIWKQRRRAGTKGMKLFEDNARAKDAPVRSDWVPVRLGIQSDWVTVRLGTQSRLGDRSDWVSFTYKYLIS